MSALLNQFVYFSFFQAILLLLIYGISVKHRQQANKYLIILVAVLLLGLCGRVFYSIELFGGSRKWVGLSEFAILMFGPTIYLFSLSLLRNRRISKRDFIHYIPAICYNLIILFYFIIPPAKIIGERVANGELFRVVSILVGIGLTVNITYFILSVNELYAFKKELEEEVSFSVSFSFLRNFLIVIGFCLVSWLSIYLVSFVKSPSFEINLRGFIWVTVAMIILFITYYHMVAPDALQYSELIEKGKYAQSKFSKGDLDRLKEELEQIMEEQKPHLNQKLLKADLAQLLGISKPELARLLNERIGMSFFEYVNYHRIQEFIKLSSQENAKDFTFFGLAQEAGFYSKATFNKSFKKIMGCTPSNFFQQ